MFTRLGWGEVDLLVWAWLSSSHQIHLSPIAHSVRKRVGSFQGAGPVPHGEINPWHQSGGWYQPLFTGEDLPLHPWRSRRSRRNRDRGYCFHRVEAAHEEKRWVVVPLWHPQYLYNRDKFVRLMTLGLLGASDEATLLVHMDTEALIGADALGEFSKLRIGNFMG